MGDRIDFFKNMLLKLVKVQNGEYCPSTGNSLHHGYGGWGSLEEGSEGR